MFHPLFQDRYPSFCFLCLVINVLCVFLPSFLFCFAVQQTLNVGTTSLQLASWHKDVTETLREHSLVLMSVHLLVPPPPAPPVALLHLHTQMRLGCTDSADFLSDGCKEKAQMSEEQVSLTLSKLSDIKCRITFITLHYICLPLMISSFTLCNSRTTSSKISCKWDMLVSFYLNKPDI